MAFSTKEPSCKQNEKVLPKELALMGQWYDVADRASATNLVRTDPRRLRGYVSVDLRVIRGDSGASSAAANRLLCT